MPNYLQPERCSSSFIVSEEDVQALLDSRSPIGTGRPRESSSLVTSSVILSILQSPADRPSAEIEERKELGNLAEEEELLLSVGDIGSVVDEERKSARVEMPGESELQKFM